MGGIAHDEAGIHLAAGGKGNAPAKGIGELERKAQKADVAGAQSARVGVVHEIGGGDVAVFAMKPPFPFRRGMDKNQHRRIVQNKIPALIGMADVVGHVLHVAFQVISRKELLETLVNKSAGALAGFLIELSGKSEQGIGDALQYGRIGDHRIGHILTVAGRGAVSGEVKHVLDDFLGDRRFSVAADAPAAADDFPECFRVQALFVNFSDLPRIQTVVENCVLGANGCAVAALVAELWRHHLNPAIDFLPGTGNAVPCT